MNLATVDQIKGSQPLAKPLNVLVADDNDSDRLLLTTIIQAAGHSVWSVADGRSAVETFKAHAIDIVLLDAMMPGMDGFDAAAEIGRFLGDEFVPIVFLTSLKDASSLARCLDVGGTDFLAKPYNQIILDAKIRALGRLRELQNTVRHQRDRLIAHQDHMIREQEVAKRVFDNIAHPGCINAPNVKAHLSPMSIFNGDMVLAARKPNGGMYVLIGDFTGHGLPAAIGAMPASEIFYGMTNKGFSLQEIIAEINKKLALILPVGVFCCCAMIELVMDRKMIQVWAGGLPELYLLRQKTSPKGGIDQHEIIEIKSRHLPLGVLSQQRFNSEVAIFEMDEGDRLYLWSDGILEASNAENTMFGSERLQNVFIEHGNSAQLFQQILESVKQFTGNQEQDDDHTLVEIQMVNQARFDSYFEETKVEQVSRTNSGPLDWQLDYRLNPQALREFNPLPLLTHILMEVPGLRGHSSKLYTILSELYSNGLEHGVLGLNSKLKTDSNGFQEYYRCRDQALAADFNGYLLIQLRHKPITNGGLLSIRFEDSGQGFDSSKACEKNTHNQYSGRGLPLLEQMCCRFEYFGNGNQVEVDYSWQYSG